MQRSSSDHQDDLRQKIGQIISWQKNNRATDERYLKLAEDHLYSEFSMLLDIPKEHMADYIEQRVHQQEEAEEQVCAV